MSRAGLGGLAITLVGSWFGVASAQVATMINGRLVPYIPHVMPAEADGPTRQNSNPSHRTVAKTSTGREAQVCPTFLQSDPDVLRVVSGYAQGSARNPKMTAGQTVEFIAATIRDEVRNTAPAVVNRNPSLFYRNFEHIDAATIANCWPNLYAVIAEKKRQEAIETERQLRDQRAKQQRQQEAEAVQAERARKQAAIDAQPANKLLRAYRFYIAVKQCFKARKGYAAVYINEEQVADARGRVLAIETTLKAADPMIDDNAIWKKANEVETAEAPNNDLTAILQMADLMGKRWVLSPEWIDESDGYCKRSYVSLSDLHVSIVPHANEVKKDF